MIDLTQHRPGEVVEVLLDDPVFDSVRKSMAAWQHRTDWKARIAHLLEHYDPAKVEPAYYCATHSRIEDGTHRLHIATLRSQATFLVEIHHGCHHHSLSVINTLRAAKLSRKDTLWLEACQEKKWSHLSREVDYYGKTVLDVGSQCGLTCLNAVFAGAVSAKGIEIRPELVHIAEAAAAKLNVAHKTDFMCGGFAHFTGCPVVGRHDIVHCMGLMHYFDCGRYICAFVDLAFAAKETLILELRVASGSGAWLTVGTGEQTLPTRGWLEKNLDDRGFDIESQFDIDGGKRLLLIARAR